MLLQRREMRVVMVPREVATSVCAVAWVLLATKITLRSPNMMMTLPPLPHVAIEAIEVTAEEAEEAEEAARTRWEEEPHRNKESPGSSIDESVVATSVQRWIPRLP